MQTVAWDQRFGRRVSSSRRRTSSQRLARLHRQSGSGRGALALSRPASRSTGSSRRPAAISPANTAISPCPTSARTARAISTTTISSSATSGIRSSAPTRTRSARPTCPTALHRARLASACREVGVLAGLRVAHGLSVVGGGRVPGLRRPAQRVGTAADRHHARLHARAAAGASRSTASRGGIKVYNVFDSGNERDVQTNVTSPDFGTLLQPDRTLDRVRGVERPLICGRRPGESLPITHSSPDLLQKIYFSGTNASPLFAFIGITS